jgi:hypothetical protein
MRRPISQLSWLMYRAAKALPSPVFAAENNRKDRNAPSSS